MSRLKTPPSHHANHVTREEPGRLVMHAQTTDYFISDHLSPCFKSPYFFSNIPKPYLWGGRFNVTLWSPLQCLDGFFFFFPSKFVSAIVILGSGQNSPGSVMKPRLYQLIATKSFMAPETSPRVDKSLV